MRFLKTNIEGAWIIELEPRADERGFFVRTYDEKIFKEQGLAVNWVQESHAFSKQKGTVRGLHFLYPPHTETKLIQMAAGEAFWAYLDVRKNSPTLGTWGSVVLSAEKSHILYLPRGIANGICTVSDNCHVLYHMDRAYDDDAKGGIQWNDPELAIPWPITDPASISPRDADAPTFKEFLEKTGGGLVL